MAAYFMIWILATLVLGYEYWALESSPSSSLLVHLQHSGWLPSEMNLSTAPGRPLSLWLGWVGLSLMIIMHVYSIRKRATFMRNLGSLRSWLNFHVFCGLLGPTLIVFHCNFKVGGLVAISFWSMIISLVSGVIGRYLMVGLLVKKSELEDYAERVLKKLEVKLQQAGVNVDPSERELYVERALRFAGLPGDDLRDVGLFGAFAHSLIGDVRLTFSDQTLAPEWPDLAERYLRTYGLHIRKAKLMSHFQRLMGAWHNFHFPFAIFMYAAAIIHVIAALIFGV